MNKILLIFFVFSFVSVIAFSQSALIKSADEEFHKENYINAIHLYQKAIKGKGGEQLYLSVIKKIGDAFNAVNQYDAAISYYKLFIEKETNPELKFLINYYELLLKTNEVKKASEGFEELKEKHPENRKIEHLYKCCQFAITEFFKSELPNIFQQHQLNSAESEFGLSFFENQLIFASQRFTETYNNIHGRTYEGYSDLYIATFDSALNIFNNPQKLSGKINTQNSEETFSFHNPTNMAYFTQCEKNPENCRILSSKNEGGKWNNAELVILGELNFNYGHPVFSENGKTMYFSSDLPGGFGGKDLWKVSVSESGNFGVPENLGSAINTGYNEVFPSTVGDSILLFASEGHTGMGGLDIFYTKLNDAVFEPVKNVGAPINSTVDDFSILINKDLNGGYFSSNRDYAKNGVDIFAFYHNIFLDNISGIVVDSILTTTLNDVKIVYKTNDEPKKIGVTDKIGKFEIQNSAHLTCRKKHWLVLTREGYVSKTIRVPCSREKKLLISLFKNTGIHSIKGKATDILSGTPLENVKIVLNTTKQKTDTVFTNGNGDYLLKNIPSNDYVFIRASKDGYLKDLKKFNTPDITETVCMSLENGYPVNFKMYPIKKDVEFIIENIFYEFDKATLFPESEVSLNKLVALLKENPQLKIKINSHTDNRGTNQYNEELSKRRGQSVVNYLLLQGIQKIRLNSEGFGERKPAIQNAKTEEEHQINRRTTFEIMGEIQFVPSLSEEQNTSEN